MGDGAVTLPPAGFNEVKAIVFDLDGTLYQDDRLGEQVHQSAIRYAAMLQGVPEAKAEAMLEKARAEQKDGTLSRAVVSLGGNLPEMHRRFALDVRPEEILKADPRVVELLRLLATRFRLYLYTNNNRELSRRIMAQIGVDGLLHEVVTIEDSWLPKPDLRIINQILDKAGLKPHEALFVGDRYQVDLAAAESIGCPVFLSRTVEELLTLTQLLH